MRAVAPPEFELLLRCSRTQVSDDQVAAIRRLSARDLDWEKVVWLAQCHGVHPLVHRALARAAPAVVPAPVMQTFESLDAGNRVRTLVLTRELLRALGALRAAGIPTVLQKGPALAVSLYADPTSRVSVDIDFKVKRRDVVKARSVFIALGYSPHRSLPRPLQSLYALVHYELAFFTAEHKGPEMEFHWRDAPWYFGLPQVPDSAWDRLVGVPLGGTEVPWLAPGDLLLDLSLHGSRHKWRTLKWIVDIAEFLRVHAQIDWGQLMHEAEERGAGRIVALAVYLAQDLLDAPVSREMSEILARSHGLPALAEEVYRVLVDPESEPLSDAYTLPFLARVADRLEAKVLCRALVLPYFVLQRLVRPSLDSLRRVVAR